MGLRTPYVGQHEGETVGEAMARVWGNAGGAGMASLASGIESARQEPLDALDQLVEMMKHPVTAAAEAAKLAGGTAGASRRCCIIAIRCASS